MSDLATALREATERFAAAGVPSPRADAELLAAHLLGCGRGEVLVALARGDALDEDRQARWNTLVERRAARTPLQHLTGRAPFRRIEVAVGPGVFVPRAETEVLAGLAIEEANALSPSEVVVVDLCTGSGAVALAIADEVPRARVVALELDPAALTWARRNVAELPAGQRVELRPGDAIGADRAALADLVGAVDVVVANPPYIPPDAVPVEAEVAGHDPAVALYGGGADGLEVPRGVVAAAEQLL
ncbi:MAG: HemK/PrmC family methyltransferase, partial [Kineosporiaceae bacterium]